MESLKIVEEAFRIPEKSLNLTQHCLYELCACTVAQIKTCQTIVLHKCLVPKLLKKFALEKSGCQSSN